MLSDIQHTSLKNLNRFRRIAYHVGRLESGLSKKSMVKEPEFDRSYGFWTPSRCDVYVASFGPQQLKLRLDVCGELWRAGVSADLQYDDNRSLEEVVADCQSQNILSVPFGMAQSFDSQH